VASVSSAQSREMHARRSPTIERIGQNGSHAGTPVQCAK